MKNIGTTCYALLSLSWAATAASKLVVDKAPDSAQPYVLPYLQGEAVNFGNTIMRFMVTAKSSGGAFSLISFNSQSSSQQPTHSHQQTEAFYVLRGEGHFWSNSDKGRTATAGDFHLLPAKNNHSYKALDPHTAVTQFFQPSGIEEFYKELGVPFDTDSNPPFDAEGDSPLNLTKAVIAAPKYGLTLAATAPLNNDFVNGTTPDGLDTWHRAEQSLPGSPVPYYVSNNRGPKYLQKSLGQVVSPLATGSETAGNATMATVAIKPVKEGEEPAAAAFEVSQALQVVEGQLMVKMEGETVALLHGDVAFIPKGAEFAYWSTVGFTKFAVYADGEKGLQEKLISEGSEWKYAVWPAL